MSGDMYSYESDQITADSFLTPLPLSPTMDGVRDPDYMLDWMEAFDSYNFEDYSRQDQFRSEPFSFGEEGNLLWKQFEDPVYSQTDPDYQPFTFPDYPLLPYQPETTTQLSGTADSSITYSSQTSSPAFSPNDSPNSSAEISVLRLGTKRRSIVTSSQEESSPPAVSRKRTRGQKYNKTQRQSDQGYASFSDNLSSPYDTENNSSEQKSPEVVTNVTRVIDGMIDKFSRSQVKLSEEEISALETAGLPIPTTLPLTKVEQNALRDVRRRLKNKQAAMENRRRKKEYVSELEIKVADFEKQVSSLEERLCRVEREKLALETELIKFRRESKHSQGSQHNSLQSGACLMVFILCFGLVCGTWFTGFGQFGSTSFNQKDIRHSFSSHHTSRTLLDAGQVQQSTFEWIYNLITTSCNQLLSHLNSNFEFVSIMDLTEKIPCHNDSCLQQ